MSGCGTIVVIIILLFVGVFVCAGITTMAPKSKQAPGIIITIAVLIATYFGLDKYYEIQTRNEKVQKEQNDKREIEELKQRIEKNGYLGLSSYQLDKIYGEPILQNEISFGVWSLTYSFGTVITQGGTVIVAPRHGTNNPDKSVHVKSLKISSGTIRNGMTSDEFVKLVSPAEVTTQTSEPDLKIPGSLVVKKLCKSGNVSFQVRLARTAYNSPYKITDIWADTSSK